MTLITALVLAIAVVAIIEITKDLNEIKYAIDKINEERTITEEDGE